MLITNDFVLLNFPKTGSTFTRKIINKVYKDKCKELLLPIVYEWRDTNQRGQHGTYSQIPLKHRNKVILSVVRNPFDRYVSQFFFKWYSHTPPESKEKLRALYPGFPEISFREFLDMVDRFSKKNILTRHGVLSDTNIGFQTIQFLAFYSNDPEGDLQKLVQGQLHSLSGLPRVHFLRQESLRQDLLDFLMKLTGDRSIAGMMTSEQDENVSRLPHEKNFNRFWTADLLQGYSEKERLILDAFPEYRPG